jgi:adenylylsulfate kinase
MVRYGGNARALAKAISWRLLGSAGTSVLVLLFTGRWDLALSIGGIEGVAKVGLYFLHERVWDRITFGRDEGRGGSSSTDRPKD